MKSTKHIEKYASGKVFLCKYILNNGHLHREDGPAIIFFGPYSYNEDYYLSGVLASREYYRLYLLVKNDYKALEKTYE
jgi:hypothetical protein